MHRHHCISGLILSVHNLIIFPLKLLCFLIGGVKFQIIATFYLIEFIPSFVYQYCFVILDDRYSLSGLFGPYNLAHLHVKSRKMISKVLE